MRCNWAAKTGSYFMHGPKLARRMMLEGTTLGASGSVWLCWPPVEEYACEFPGAGVSYVRLRPAVVRDPCRDFGCHPDIFGNNGVP